MKYWRLIVGLLILPLVLVPNKLLPIPANSGEIIQISPPIQEPLPHREVTLKTSTGQVNVLAYDEAGGYKVGDLVNYSSSGDNLVVSEKYRLPALVSLTSLFVLIVIVVSGVHGIQSLMGLLFSFLIIFRFVLPQIIVGSNPILVALLASLMILIVSYFLTHGVNSKTVIAICGTFAALVVTGILAVVYSRLAGLTGFGSEETGYLLGNLPRESFYKLLLAGIIIASLGVLDDITISQASIVAELKAANHKLGMAELFARAMRIGHDHIASLVNTLVLVYAGSALPLLLLFVVSDTNYLSLLNYEALSEEIVRTIVSSIGLIAAVPLTTLIASFYYATQKQ